MKDMPIQQIAENELKIKFITEPCYLPVKGDKLFLKENMKAVKVPFKDNDGNYREFTKVLVEGEFNGKKDSKYITMSVLGYALRNKPNIPINILCTETCLRLPNTFRLVGQFTII